MIVLLSNDDGINAVGLRILAQAMREAGADVWVSAPDRERSAVSHAETQSAGSGTSTLPEPAANSNAVMSAPDWMTESAALPIPMNSASMERISSFETDPV